MFGSSILEVAIGLVFVYLLLSLVCTTANELIAALTTWRAINLEQGIRNLLNDPSGNALAKVFYEHPLIKGLYRDEKRKPSYIPSRTFALTLMDIALPADHPRPKTVEEIRQALADTKTLNPQVQKALLVLIDEAGNNLDKTVTDLNKVYENFEIWFNHSMDRVAGWYKRKTQALTFGLAILFTFVLNIDTISISKSLSNDSALRASVIAAAQEATKQPPILISAAQPAPPGTGTETAAQGAGTQTYVTNPEAAYEKLRKQIYGIQQLGIPIGWDISFPDNNSSKTQIFWWWLTKFFGLLLTAGAASMGAPFWFDILNKIITIRSAGKAPEEKPKPPKEVPKPLEPGETATPTPKPQEGKPIPGQQMGAAPAPPASEQ